MRARSLITDVDVYCVLLGLPFANAAPNMVHNTMILPGYMFMYKIDHI